MKLSRYKVKYMHRYVCMVLVTSSSYTKAIILFGTCRETSQMVHVIINCYVVYPRDNGIH